MSIKYLHYRYYVQSPKLSGISIEISSRRGATVAYIVGELGTSYAVAYCGPNDNYNKRMGRAKAGGRLNSERYLETAGTTTASEFIRRMDEEMAFIHKYYRNVSNW